MLIQMARLGRCYASSVKGLGGGLNVGGAREDSKIIPRVFT